MKLCLLGDVHYGIKNDAPNFYNYFNESIDWMLEYMEREEIDTIIQLGDVVDRRKYINYVTANRMRYDFLDKIDKCGIDLAIIAGNHDEYYKDTPYINALSELIGDRYRNIHYHVGPTLYQIGDLKIGLIPWINKENEANALDAIKTWDVPLLLGHLHLIGFEEQRGHLSLTGLDRSLFSKYELVCSGHFHTRSSQDNIQYIGSFCEFYWSDYNDPKGFSVYDTETRELTFVQNPYKMYHKVWYDDSHKAQDEILNFDPQIYSDKIVKVIVQNKTNPYTFDLFIDKLQEGSPADVSVNDDHLHLDDVPNETIGEEAQETLEFFKEYVGKLSDAVDKLRLNSTIERLHRRALTEDK